jgi:hypothetical protein
MATWSEFMNTEKRVQKHNVGEVVKWKSGSEKDFGKIISGKIDTHEWCMGFKKGKEVYYSRYDVRGDDGFEYVLNDESIIG